MLCCSPDFTNPDADEIAAVTKLESIRAETQRLKEISFPTISGSGPHGDDARARAVGTHAIGSRRGKRSAGWSSQRRRRRGQLLEVMGRDHDRERGLVGGEPVERSESARAAASESAMAAATMGVR